jgi:2'-5' RNA ligase
MRTFVAIDLGPDIKDRLAALVARLQPLGGDIKWVSREAMHLTLKFLGEIDEKQAAAVAEALGPVCSGRASFSLACLGTGTFPPGAKSPRVLWVGVMTGPELGLLREEIETACAGLGFERESRPFRPHLTLGRVKGFSGLGRLVAELEKSREEEFGRMSVRSVVFFESRLKPSGAEYRALKEFPLA